MAVDQRTSAMDVKIQCDSKCLQYCCATTTTMWSHHLLILTHVPPSLFWHQLSDNVEDIHS